MKIGVHKPEESLIPGHVLMLTNVLENTVPAVVSTKNLECSFAQTKQKHNVKQIIQAMIIAGRVEKRTVMEIQYQKMGSNDAKIIRMIQLVVMIHLHHSSAEFVMI